jgi:hypothetical protein
MSVYAHVEATKNDFRLAQIVLRVLQTFIKTFMTILIDKPSVSRTRQCLSQLLTLQILPPFTLLVIFISLPIFPEESDTWFNQPLHVDIQTVTRELGRSMENLNIWRKTGFRVDMYFGSNYRMTLRHLLQDTRLMLLKLFLHRGQDPDRRSEQTCSNHKSRRQHQRCRN